MEQGKCAGSLFGAQIRMKEKGGFSSVIVRNRCERKELTRRIGGELDFFFDAGYHQTKVGVRGFWLQPGERGTTRGTHWGIRE